MLWVTNLDRLPLPLGAFKSPNHAAFVTPSYDESIDHLFHTWTSLFACYMRRKDPFVLNSFPLRDDVVIDPKSLTSFACTGAGVLTTEFGGFNGGDADSSAGGGGGIDVCDAGGGGAVVVSESGGGGENCGGGFRLDGGGGEFGFTIGAGGVGVIGTDGFGDDEPGGAGGEDPSTGGFGFGFGVGLGNGVMKGEEEEEEDESVGDEQ
ncbi:hypothetical protein Bca52824_086609 [Brassica carinata]|uniref:Uncharacterized protein n=1 Tax=Brassica carinata TaxID=52824 RepID=A0A8X7TP13_BRACI|nr:hypothetical protein Bca52824_086609 [Brassica carinata]